MLTLCPECKQHYNNDHQKGDCPHNDFRTSALSDHIVATRAANKTPLGRQDIVNSARRRR